MSCLEHHPQLAQRRSMMRAAISAALGKRKGRPTAEVPMASSIAVRARDVRFAHLFAARFDALRVMLKDRNANLSAFSSVVSSIESPRTTAAGQCDQRLSRRNGLAFVSPRQKVTNNRGLSMTTAIALDPYDSMEPVAFNGWWVAGATCLFASSPLFWVAVLASPDWLRNTILSAAAMLALGLIVFGLVCSFLDGLDDSVSELRDVLS